MVLLWHRWENDTHLIFIFTYAVNFNIYLYIIKEIVHPVCGQQKKETHTGLEQLEGE